MRAHALSRAARNSTVLMTALTRIGRDALKVLVVLETLDKHDVKLIIQGGDMAEGDDNPLIKCLRRFNPRPSLDTTE